MLPRPGPLALALALTVACAPGSERASPDPEPSARAQPEEPGPMDALVSAPIGDGFVRFDDADLRDSTLPVVGVIVPGARAAEVLQEPPETTTWTPSVGAALALGETLKRHVDAEHPQLAETWPERQLQVFGLEGEDGPQLLVRARCRPSPGWERRGPDGDPCPPVVAAASPDGGRLLRCEERHEPTHGSQATAVTASGS